MLFLIGLVGVFLVMTKFQPLIIVFKIIGYCIGAIIGIILLPVIWIFGSNPSIQSHYNLQ